MARELPIETKLSEAEAASERAERLGGLLALSHEAMLMWKLNGSIEFWNAGAERLYGFAQEEAIGNISHALLQTKFPVEFTDYIKLLQSERHWSGELHHICKDGREVVVESRQQVLSDGTVIEVNRDITEQKKIEQQMMFLASIVQSSDDAIVSKVSTALSPVGTGQRSAYSAKLPTRHDHYRNPQRPGRMKSANIDAHQTG